MKRLRTRLLPAALILLFCPFFSFAQKALDTATIRQLVHKYASRLHISVTDADNALITSTYLEKETGIQYVYLQQSYQQLSVFNSILSLSFKNGLLVYAAGKFIDSIATRAGSATPTIGADQALAKTTAHLRLKAPDGLKLMANRMDTRERKMIFSPSGVAKKNIEATLLWVSGDDGATVHLAWNVNIDVLGSNDWWNVRVDAINGTVINKNNWTIYEMAPDEVNKRSQGNNAPPFHTVPSVPETPPNVTGAVYKVIPFPAESPNFSSAAADNEPWLRASSYNTNAVTEGWHFDGVSNYTITRGNNVFAYLDYDASNIANATTNFPDTSTTSAPALTFSNTPDLTQRPFATVNRKFALDNLFYWNNLMHDVSYQYGFTEAAGNFQNDNMGRGGMGNDCVLAQGQDGLGTSNANFTTPGDGTSGVMRMYQFPQPLVCTISSPAAVARSYAAIEGFLSVNNLLMNIGAVTGQLIYFNDDIPGTTHQACAGPANAITGFIALIDNGGCASYAQKIKNAQNAGAIAVIIVNNSAGIIPMTGSDNTINIPAIMISQADGVSLAAELSNNVQVTLSRGVGYDGDVDNGVVCHEYTHGISTRLTGGPASASCLVNSEQAGEGWSDYMALMMTTNWTTASLADGANAHPLGTWVSGQPATGSGIRRHPYSTNMAIDPITYVDMAGSGEVHNIGEIWCSALWDMTWNIIQQTGSITPSIYNSSGTGGNTIALKLVITGLKLQPCTPGFIDARNAILAADSILYNSAHKCAIWTAFARRGMGFSALQGSNNSTFDQTAAFDLPSGAVLIKSVTPLSLITGSQVTITHTATCNCQSPLNNYSIRDTIPAGFTYVSSTGGSLSGNVVTFSPVSFATAQQSLTFSVTLQAGMTGCSLDSSINDNRDNATAGGFTPAIITGSSNWSASTQYAHTGTHSWNGADPGSLSNTTLTSNPFTVGALSILSFWHYFNIEGSYDGGVVELSANGITWMDASPYIMEYPYTIKMDPSSILAGRNAYSGGNGTFRRTTINLSTFAGQTLRIRFRMTSDISAGGDGWFIDDIVVANGCGGTLKSGLMNVAAALVDTSAVPVFVLPASALPLTLLQFNARPAGREVLLTWQTSQEFNTKAFDVERSGDGLTSWTAIGTVPALSQGNGNYVLYDNKPLQDINYYRLKMSDIDLQFTYSPIRQVRMSDSPGFVIIPNPATSQASIHFTPVMYSPEILVTDANGRLVEHSSLSGSASYYTLPTALLGSGVYTVTVRSGSNTVTGKLVVVH